MNNLEIKACPFCNSDELSVGTNSDYPESHTCWVACHNCYAAGPAAGTEYDAVCYWNATRAGVRKPATPEPKELKALALATCSAADADILYDISEKLLGISNKIKAGVGDGLRGDIWHLSAELFRMACGKSQQQNAPHE